MMHCNVSYPVAVQLLPFASYEFYSYIKITKGLKEASLRLNLILLEDNLSLTKKRISEIKDSEYSSVLTLRGSNVEIK